MKLFDHFSVLYSAFDTAEVRVGLPVLASTLKCSERNVAVILEKMSDQRWIRWSSGRGRGNFSTLTFLSSPQQLRAEELSKMLSAGNVDKLFSTLAAEEKKSFSERLAELFLHSPGSRNHSRLDIPLFRSVLSLDPVKTFVRVETHLVEQIFSRLTEFDQLSQRLVPGLAHHWEGNEAGDNWQFWIRPNIRCHDGSLLTLEAIKRSILRTQAVPGNAQVLFAHLKEIVIDGPRKLIFRLSEPDAIWPHRLSSARSSIVPFECGEAFPEMPVGTGPFAITRRDGQRLTLKAFDEYYRERAFLDEIDLWLVPADTEVQFDLDFGSGSDSGSDTGSGAGASDSNLERRVSKLYNGCYYLLCNPDSEGFSKVGNRFALADILSDALHESPFDKLCIQAEGILRGWNHRANRGTTQLEVVPGSRVSIATSPRPLSMLLAQAARARLRALGCAAEVLVIGDKERAGTAWMSGIDVYVCGEVLSEDEDYGCYEWLTESSAFRHWMQADQRQLLDDKLKATQRMSDRDQRVRSYVALFENLVATASVIPIAHERLQVRAANHVGGVNQIANGFVPFAEIWLR